MNTPLRTYAEAYIAAFPPNRDAVAEVDACADALRDIRPLRAFLQDVSVSLASRRKALGIALPHVSPETINLFTLLARDERLADSEALRDHVRTAAADRAGKTHVTVSSAVPLTDEDIKRISVALKKKFGTAVHVETRMDPSVLAGLRITANGWTFDATLAHRLKRLQHALTV